MPRFVLVIILSLFILPITHAQESSQAEITEIPLQTTANIEAIEVSEAGRMVIAYNDLTVVLYDLETLEEVNRYSIGSGDLFVANGIHFSPDESKYLVQTYYAVYLFDSQSGELLNSLDITLDDVAFAPDSQSIYILANDEIMSYDAETLAPISSTRIGEDGDGRQASDVEILDDGTVVTLIPDDSFEYYIHRLPSDLSSITPSSFTGRGLIATSAGFTTIFYRDLTAIGGDYSFEFDTSTVCGDFISLDVSPNGKYIVGAGDKCGIYLFNSSTIPLIYEHLLDDVVATSMTNDTIYVATTSGVQAITIPELVDESTSGETTAVDEPGEETTSAEPTAESVPTETQTDINYLLEYVTTVSGDVDIAAVVARPDGTQFAGISGFDNRIATFDSVNLTEIARYQDSAGTSNITYTPDGQYLIATDADKQVLIFDAQSLVLLHRVAQPIDFVIDITASNTTAYALGQNEDRQGMIFTVDIQTGTVSQPIQAFVSLPFLGFEYQPDDTLIGLGFGDGVQLVKTWDANLNELSAVTTEQYWASALFGEKLLFSTEQRENDEIFVGYSVADSIDQQSSALLMEDMLCRRPPVNLAMTPDAGLAVATNFKCPVYFFNVTSGLLMQTLERDDVKDGAFSIDGQYLYLATQTGIDVYRIVVEE